VAEKILSDAKKKANKKWNDAHMKERYDRIQLVVPKGQKSQIQAHAKKLGKTLNGFVVRAINDSMTAPAVEKVAQPPEVES
jgi:hypothetical protein